MQTVVEKRAPLNHLDLIFISPLIVFVPVYHEIEPVDRTGHSIRIMLDLATSTGCDAKDGLKSYYVTKIEELQLVVSEKTQNLRRLQAQRNELNAKGKCHSLPIIWPWACHAVADQG